MLVRLDGAGASTTLAPATSPAAPATDADAPPTPLPQDGTQPPLDDTADIPEALSTALARRAELQLLLAHERDQTQQAKLDRMRSDFDNEAALRAEQLREVNALRDMSIEQQKKDDEVLKKFIAMI